MNRLVYLLRFGGVRKVPSNMVSDFAFVAVWPSNPSSGCFKNGQSLYARRNLSSFFLHSACSILTLSVVMICEDGSLGSGFSTLSVAPLKTL